MVRPLVMLLPAGPQRSLANCTCPSWVLGEDTGKDRGAWCPGYPIQEGVALAP